MRTSFAQCKNIKGTSVQPQVIIDNGWRKVLCQKAVKRLAYSGAAVGAPFLGVTTLLMNRYASFEEVGDSDQYL